jgi:hypothetical protein
MLRQACTQMQHNCENIDCRVSQQSPKSLISATKSNPLNMVLKVINQNTIEICEARQAALPEKAREKLPQNDCCASYATCASASVRYDVTACKRDTDTK